jgi:hypothetical protein
MLGQDCTHLDQINAVEPSAEGCEECLQMGDSWVHLRECLICGHVGCCDSSVSLPVRNAILFRAALSPAGLPSHEVALA